MKLKQISINNKQISIKVPRYLSRKTSTPQDGSTSKQYKIDIHLSRSNLYQNRSNHHQDRISVKMKTVFIKVHQISIKRQMDKTECAEPMSQTMSNSKMIAADEHNAIDKKYAHGK